MAECSPVKRVVEGSSPSVPAILQSVDARVLQPYSPIGRTMKILFLLKKKNSYSCRYDYTAASGLFNSATFVADMLNAAGVEAKVEEVVDNNNIDKAVHDYRPSVVIIEALWVVPEKFDVLKKLHPQVRWIVRLHSDIPFLASEGVAFDWIFGYLKRGVDVAFNSPKAVVDLRAIAHENRHHVLYLPNFYPVYGQHNGHSGDYLNIGCFGAIRPMKNQMVQAIAAIRFADERERHLRFHINTARCETGGENVLKNLRSLFANTEHTLVETPWLEHPEFLDLMSTMDLAMAVSLSETFCITAADAVNVNTPLVCSSEIPWASEFSIAPTTDATGIVRKMNNLLSPAKFLINHLNRRNLKRYSERSREIWLRHFGA